MAQYVIFSTDNQGDLRSLSKAVHQVDVVAAMRTTEPIVPVFGMYKGKPELSFCCTVQDWVDFIQHSYYVQGQEGVLVLDTETTNVFLVEKDGGGEPVYLGKWTEVSPSGVDLDAWSYFPQTGKYYLIDPVV